jgi:hypothetical protein
MHIKDSDSSQCYSLNKLELHNFILELYEIVAADKICLSSKAGNKITFCKFNFW